MKSIQCYQREIDHLSQATDKSRFPRMVDHSLWMTKTLYSKSYLVNVYAVTNSYRNQFSNVHSVLEVKRAESKLNSL